MLSCATEAAMDIDAHQHFWILARRRGDWPPPALERIHRDFLPADLVALLARHGISGTVLVQSEPRAEDTAFLLELAAQHDFIRAVVGWVDLQASDAPQRIAALAGIPKLRGLRPMLQDLPEDDWICRAQLDPAVRAMTAHGLRFDALVRPRHLPALLRFARRHPGLPIVIDHAAKPDIAHERLDPWRADIAALAQLENVYCKLSGLLTESGGACTGAVLRPYVAHLLAVFGPQRLMWGSDWPVLEQSADYGYWRSVTAELLADLDMGPRSAIQGGTARSFYGLE
jgi:L-fuconolactonase